MSGDEKIGRVSVQKEGLYYRIVCRCFLTGTVRYKLVAKCGEHSEDLGLCVPYGYHFGVETSIPIKRLGDGELSFHLVPKHERMAGQFIAVSPLEPFKHIQNLQVARFARLDGQIGIVLPEDQRSSDKPTGQWSDPITSE